MTPKSRVLQKNQILKKVYFRKFLKKGRKLAKQVQNIILEKILKKQKLLDIKFYVLYMSHICILDRIRMKSLIIESGGGQEHLSRSSLMGFMITEMVLA